MALTKVGTDGMANSARNRNSWAHTEIHALPHTRKEIAFIKHQLLPKETLIWLSYNLVKRWPLIVDELKEEGFRVVHELPDNLELCVHNYSDGHSWVEPHRPIKELQVRTSTNISYKAPLIGINYQSIPIEEYSKEELINFLEEIEETISKEIKTDNKTLYKYLMKRKGIVQDTIKYLCEALEKKLD